MKSEGERNVTEACLGKNLERSKRRKKVRFCSTLSWGEILNKAGEAGMP